MAGRLVWWNFACQQIFGRIWSKNMYIFWFQYMMHKKTNCGQFKLYPGQFNTVIFGSDTISEIYVGLDCQNGV